MLLYIISKKFVMSSDKFLGSRFWEACDPWTPSSAHASDFYHHLHWRAINWTWFRVSTCTWLIYF